MELLIIHCYPGYIDFLYLIRVDILELRGILAEPRRDCLVIEKIAHPRNQDHLIASLKSTLKRGY